MTTPTARHWLLLVSLLIGPSGCALGTLLAEIQGGNDNCGSGDGGNGSDGGHCSNNNNNCSGNNCGNNNNCDGGNCNNNNQQVAIQSVQPNQVMPGQAITILGNGFDSPPVSVNTSVGACPTSSVTNSQIVCTTPANIQPSFFGISISVTVQTANGNANLNSAFMFEEPMLFCTGFMPTTVSVGDQLTLQGENLQQSNVTVSFSGSGPSVSAQPSTDTTITVQVPQGAQTGPVTVEYQGGMMAACPGTLTVQ